MLDQYIYSIEAETEGLGEERVMRLSIEARPSHKPRTLYGISSRTAIYNT